MLLSSQPSETFPVELDNASKARLSWVKSVLAGRFHPVELTTSAILRRALLHYSDALQRDEQKRYQQIKGHKP